MGELPFGRLSDHTVPLSIDTQNLFAEGRDIDSLIIAGAETDVCVLAAALDAVDFGYRVVLATDALGSSSDASRYVLLTLYRNRFGQQIEMAASETILASWE